MTPRPLLTRRGRHGALVRRGRGTLIRRGLGALALGAVLIAGCTGRSPESTEPAAPGSAAAAEPGPSPSPGDTGSADPREGGREPPAASPPVVPAAESPGEPFDASPASGALWQVSLAVGPDGMLGLLLEGRSAPGVPADAVPVTTDPARAQVAGPTAAAAPEGAATEDTLVDPVAADPTLVTIDPALVHPGTALTLSLTTPGSLAATTDGGLVLRDRAGAVAAGIAPPTGGARLVLDDAATARLVLRAPAEGQLPPPVTLSIGVRAVVSAQWRERSDGPSLFVDPTPWARTSGEAGWALVWAELLAAHPEVDTPGMHDQLVCHGVGAPDKETWNLEPWRPDVGLLAVMAARCNPTPA